MKFGNKLCETEFLLTDSPLNISECSSSPYCHTETAFLNLKAAVGSFLLSICGGRRAAGRLLMHHSSPFGLYGNLRHCALWIPRGPGSLNEVLQVPFWISSQVLIAFTYACFLLWGTKSNSKTKAKRSKKHSDCVAAVRHKMVSPFLTKSLWLTRCFASEGTVSQISFHSSCAALFYTLVCFLCLFPYACFLKAENSTGAAADWICTS